MYIAKRLLPDQSWLIFALIVSKTDNYKFESHLLSQIQETGGTFGRPPQALAPIHEFSPLVGSLSLPFPHQSKHECDIPV
jgi:hypothetical protein